MEQRLRTLEAVVSGPFAWTGRRVFLTGHTGFKGGWLAIWLKHLGAHVRGYALDPSSSPNFFGATHTAAGMEDIRGDLSDLPRLAESVRSFAPEIVFHLAAQPLVREGYAHPLDTYQTNVMGTVHVLEAVRQTPSVRAVVCVTTDKVYENREDGIAFREDDPLGGYDPYSSSKAAAELVAAAYRQSFFSSSGGQCLLATARAGNVIGGGDWSADRLLPDLLHGFERGEMVPIRRPESVRPWQHVVEPLSGYLRLGEKLLQSDGRCARAYNFGPAAEDAWPVRRIVEQVARLWGNGARWTMDAASGVHEAHTLMLDASRAEADLGWRPRLRLETALEWLVQWHRGHMRGEDMREATLQQIADFQALSDQV